MLHNIIAAIICTQFEKQFRKNDFDHAMEVELSLHVDYDRECGYRNLTLRIFGGGSNYISVFGKLDWRVTSNVTWDSHTGSAPWILLCHHDSGWRGAIESILWDYRDRLASISSMGNEPTGWYRRVPMSDEDKAASTEIIRNTPGYGGEGKRLKLQDLDFQFPKEEVTK